MYDVLAEEREEGKIEGKREGEQRASQLYKHLLLDGRLEDLRCSVDDAGLREQLYEEYRL